MVGVTEFDMKQSWIRKIRLVHRHSESEGGEEGEGRRLRCLRFYAFPKINHKTWTFSGIYFLPSNLPNIEGIINYNMSAKCPSLRNLYGCKSVYYGLHFTFLSPWFDFLVFSVQWHSLFIKWGIIETIALAIQQNSNAEEQKAIWKLILKRVREYWQTTFPSSERLTGVIQWTPRKVGIHIQQTARNLCQKPTAFRAN